MIRFIVTRDGPTIQGTNPKVDAFIAAIRVLSIQHGMSIAHEDYEGSFIIEPYDEQSITWLQNATDKTKTI